MSVVEDEKEIEFEEINNGVAALYAKKGSLVHTT
jgi:hypothetical protein